MKYTVLLLMLLASVAQAEDAAQERLKVYAQSAAKPFSAERGGQFWQQKFYPLAGKPGRSCSVCHGVELDKPGKHARTGKVIKPMSRSANPRLLTDTRKIEKWFKRNCKWTLGRECSAQEKGDVLSYLLSGGAK